MTSIVDSTAHFEPRLAESGIIQASIDAIKASGVDTLSRLAFTVGQPNQPLSHDEINAFLPLSPSSSETGSVEDAKGGKTKDSKQTSQCLSFTHPILANKICISIHVRLHLVLKLGPLRDYKRAGHTSSFGSSEITGCSGPSAP